MAQRPTDGWLPLPPRPASDGGDSRGILQINHRAYSSLLDVGASARAFLAHRSGTAAGSPISQFASHAPGGLDWAQWRQEFAASLAEQLDDEQARALNWGGGIPAGEVYAIRAHCTGKYLKSLRSMRPGCGWAGAMRRTSGSEHVPACPQCGGLTEPIPGSPRLRAV